MPLPSQLAAAQRTLAAGVARRRALLVSSFPLVVLETTPGSGASTLLRDWAAMPDTPELRVLLEADKLAATGGQLLAAMVRLVRAEADQSEAGRPADWTVSASATDLSQAVTTLRRPLTVALLRADFLSHRACCR